MKRMLEVYKHRHDYIDDVFKEYCKIVSRFDKKSSSYYADIRDFEADWNERYDATKENMNLILYGNKEGKESKENKNRSELYLKIVHRNPTYKNWNKIGLGIMLSSVVMNLLWFINCFYQLFPRNYNEKYIFFFIFWVIGIFIPADVKFLSCLAENYKARKNLTDRQMNHLYKLMPKYANQLINYSIEVGKVYKVGREYRFR